MRIGVNECMKVILPRYAFFYKYSHKERPVTTTLSYRSPEWNYDDTFIFSLFRRFPFSCSSFFSFVLRSLVLSIVNWLWCSIIEQIMKFLSIVDKAIHFSHAIMNSISIECHRIKRKMPFFKPIFQVFPFFGWNWSHCWENCSVSNRYSLSRIYLSHPIVAFTTHNLCTTRYVLSVFYSSNKGNNSSLFRVSNPMKMSENCNDERTTIRTNYQRDRVMCVCYISWRKALPTVSRSFVLYGAYVVYEISFPELASIICYWQMLSCNRYVFRWYNNPVIFFSFRSCAPFCKWTQLNSPPAHGWLQRSTMQHGPNDVGWK